MLQVAIIGAGITGLSVIHHLRAKGMTRVAIFAGGMSASDLSPGVAIGGMSDLITRISHARGLPTAQAIWQFGNDAQGALLAALTKAGIPFKRNAHVRLGLSSPESAELSAAYKQMSAVGFQCKQAPPEDTWSSSLNSLSSLWEKDVSAAFDLSSALNSWSAGHKSPAKKVVSVSSKTNGAELKLDSGERIGAEFIVLANHLAAADVYPRAESWLVSYGDQWSLIEAEGIPPDAVGGTVTWNFGYNRLTFVNEHQVALSGGRTLRKGAAIGVTEIEFRADVCDKLGAEFKKICPTVTLGARKLDHAFLECRPCDELPIIGPIHGEERLLIGSGYMGQGLSLGFFAGKCLADIICDGRSRDLPDILMPRRLRSLSEA